MNRTGWIAAVVMGSILATAPLAQAADKAKQFMKGGVFCFQIGTPAPGGWDTRVMLTSFKSKGKSPNRISHVDGLWRGAKASANPPESYVSPMTGSATIAPPNDDLSGPEVLQIGLESSDYGAHNGATGLWTGWYTFSLDTTGLKGRVTARKRFTPIVAGEPPVSTYDESLSEAVTPISCKAF